jgi:hypothetical protein
MPAFKPSLPRQRLFNAETAPSPPRIAIVQASNGIIPAAYSRMGIRFETIPAFDQP